MQRVHATIVVRVPIPAPIAAAVDAAIWHPGYPEAGYEPPIRRVVVDES